MYRSLGLFLLLTVLTSSPAMAALIGGAPPYGDASAGFEWRDDSFRSASHERLLPGDGDDTHSGWRLPAAPGLDDPFGARLGWDAAWSHAGRDAFIGFAAAPALFAGKNLAIVFGHRDERALAAFYGAAFRDLTKGPWFDDGAGRDLVGLFDHEDGTMPDMAFIWWFIPVSSPDPVETLAETTAENPPTRPSNASVPEPASVALLGAGLLILGVVRRQKAKAD